MNMAYTLNTLRGTILFNLVDAFENVVHELSFSRNSDLIDSLYSLGICSLNSSNGLFSLFLGRLIRVSFRPKSRSFFSIFSTSLSFFLSFSLRS